MKAVLRFSSIPLFLGAVLFLSSCYPGGPTSSSERDLVTTIFDQNADFQAKRTYAMPDEVLRKEGSEEVSDEFDNLILADVARNMAQMGYTREMNTEANGADVVLLVSIATQTNYVAWTSWPWWGGWGGWGGWGWWGGWGPGWGVGYPGVSVSSYEVGSVFIDMYDPNKRDVENEVVPVIWAAGLNGLVSSGGDGSRITEGINQAYTQSSYLRTQ